MSIDLIFMKCPNCSAGLELIPGSKTGQCEFCGSSFVISSHKTKAGKGEVSGKDIMEFNRDWAQKISELAVKRFQDKHKIDLTEDSNAMERIEEVSGKVATELEEQENATMNIPFIAATSNGPLHICEEYTRSDVD